MGVALTSKAKRARLDRVIWCDRGWQPVFFGFVPSKAAWDREVKRLGAKGDPYPQSAGCASTYAHQGKVAVLVTLSEKAEKRHNRVEIAGILAHEATHVWQQVREKMGERWPSIEFEAYSIQAIFQGLYQAWLDTRAPEAMQAACAKREKVK